MRDVCDAERVIVGTVCVVDIDGDCVSDGVIERLCVADDVGEAVELDVRLLDAVGVVVRVGDGVRVGDADAVSDRRVSDTVTIGVIDRAGVLWLRDPDRDQLIDSVPVSVSDVVLDGEMEAVGEAVPDAVGDTLGVVLRVSESDELEVGDAVPESVGVLEVVNVGEVVRLGDRVRDPRDAVVVGDTDEETDADHDDDGE